MTTADGNSKANIILFNNLISVLLPDYLIHHFFFSQPLAQNAVSQLNE